MPPRPQRVTHAVYLYSQIKRVHPAHFVPPSFSTQDKKTDHKKSELDFKIVTHQRPAFMKPVESLQTNISSTSAPPSTSNSRSLDQFYVFHDGHNEITRKKVEGLAKGISHLNHSEQKIAVTFSV